jgi:hypothetical protein
MRETFWGPLFEFSFQRCVEALKGLDSEAMSGNGRCKSSGKSMKTEQLAAGPEVNSCNIANYTYCSKQSGFECNRAGMGRHRAVCRHEVKDSWWSESSVSSAATSKLPTKWPLPQEA